MGIQKIPRVLFASVVEFGSHVQHRSGSGAPTNGVTGAGSAGPGSIYVRESNGGQYINTGTKASPTWSLAGSVTPGSIVNADLDAAAAIARTKLATNAAQAFDLELLGVDGAALVAAESAGTFNRSIAANVHLIKGEVTDNETEVSVGYASFRLPAEYVAAGAITVRMRSAIIATGGATDNGSTLDLEAYKSDGSGAVGADICATVAATFAALGTWYSKDFTITATGLAAGDLLNFKVTSSIIDSEAGAGTLRLNMEPLQILLAVQG